MNINKTPQNTNLFNELCTIIENSKNRIATTVNFELTLMYWNIGNRINTEILKNERAEYGKQIISTLSIKLQEKYGKKGFDTRNIRRMMKFAESFLDFEIVATVSPQLSWSHFTEIIILKDELQREFYITMASAENWSVRTLRERINSMLYERTLISGKCDDFIKKELATSRNENVISPDLVFKNPYFFDFTGLKGYYSEKDLEDVLLTELQNFMLELGNGFTFVERQKRLIIDNEDFYIDLLFFHRKLKRLIAIELKLGKFKTAYKGQMELYLRYLDKYEKQEGENSPLGLLLCSEGGNEQIELLQLGDSGIQVSQYFTELPNKKLLQEQLHKQLEFAKERFLQKENIGELSEVKV